MATPDLSNPDSVFSKGNSATPFVVEGDVHCWSLAGPRLQVEMHSSAVSRISHDLTRTTAPHEWPAGLLLGKMQRLDTGMVRLKITGVEACDFRELDGVLLNSDLVLGFYRINGPGELAFTDLDLTLARWRFSDPDRIFLLVRASGLKHADVRFFYWNDKGIGFEESEFPVALRWGPPHTPVLSRPAGMIEPDTPAPPDEEMDWEHPAKARALRLISSIADRVRKSREAPSILQESIFEEPAPAIEPELSSSGWRRLAKPAILTLSVVIAVALITLAVIHRSGNTPVRLNLTTTLVAGGLRLSWNKDAPVASATEGLLSISDGETKQELSLNSKQLREETVIYMPTSDSVSFTLQVFADGVVHRDSITVLTPHPPLTAGSGSAPTSIPEQPQPPLLNPSSPQSARPETVVRAPPQPKIENPESRELVSRDPPAPRPAAAPPISAPPSVDRAPAQASATSPAKEQPVPERPIVLPRPERRQDSPVAQQPTPPELIPEPAAPPFIPPAAPQAPVVSAAPTAARHIPPQPIRQVKPMVPRSLKALISREIVMDVNLSIDESGKVTKAEPSTGSGVLQTSLGKLAAEAARHWKFQPARQGNRNVPGEVRIQFQFGPGN